jgi:hypothetical protein
MNNESEWKIAALSRRQTRKFGAQDPILAAIASFHARVRSVRSGIPSNEPNPDR